MTTRRRRAATRRTAMKWTIWHRIAVSVLVGIAMWLVIVALVRLI